MNTRSLAHFFMNRSLFTKIFVSICLVAMLAIFAMASLYEYYFKNILIDNEIDRVQRSINQASLNLDNQLKRIANDMSYFFIYSDSGMDMLEAVISDDVITDDMYSASRALESFRMRYSGDLESVFLFRKDEDQDGKEKESLIHELSFQQNMEIDYREQQWYRNFTNKRDVLWTTPSSDHLFFQDKSLRTIYLTMANYSMPGRDGIFVVRLNGKMFSDAFRLLATSDLYIELHNPSGEVIYSSLPPASSVQSEDWIPMSADLGFSGFRVIAQVNKPSIVNAVHELGSIRALVIAVVLVLTFIISVLLSLTLVKPIKALLRLMSKVEKGDFNVRFPTRYSDEIGVLGLGFSKMVSRVSELVQQVYVVRMEHMEATIRQKEAIILAMQSQINPHFLYNTLETINCHAIVHEVPSVMNMSKALADFFRYSIEKQQIDVTLQDEITHVHTYLRIQEERYPQVEIDIAIDEMLLSYPILKLSLQPIIENTYAHAFIGKRDYFIRLYGEQVDEHTYVIHVEDNGEGMSDECLASYAQRLKGPVDQLSERTSKEEYRHGIGLMNVHARIRLRYGDPYGLQLSHADAGGLLVSLYLPTSIALNQGGEEQ